MKQGFSFQKQCILQDFCLGMHTNQHFEIIISTKIKENVSKFTFLGKNYTCKLFHQKI